MEITLSANPPKNIFEYFLDNITLNLFISGDVTALFKSLMRLEMIRF